MILIFGLNGALNIVVSILWAILMILLLAGLLWLLLPYIFRWFVCPHFDGSYSPKDDIYGECFSSEPQNNAYHLELAENGKKYTINFGKGRIFDNGNVKIKYNGTVYAASPNSDETALVFIQANSTKNFDHPLGHGTKTSWKWGIPGQKIEFSTSFIQLTDKNNVLIFEFESENEIPQISSGNPKESVVSFPIFDNKSINKRIFTYKNLVFSPGARDLEYEFSPVCLFDDQANVAIISALNHFVTNGIQKVSGVDPKEYQIACGVSGEVQELPKNHAHQYILVFHNGINAGFQYWGDQLLQFYGRTRAERDRYRDIDMSYLGYYTDNGAHYYYNPLEGKGYDDTLLAVKAYADSEGIPIRYYHLDSWWYQKSVKQGMIRLLGGFGRLLGGGLYGGTTLWEEEPSVFTMPIEGEKPLIKRLSEKMNNAVFSAHNRWYSDKSPYVQKYNFIIEGNNAMPKDSPEFWEEIMKNAKERNIVTYEQDWLKTHISRFSFLRSEIGAAHTWLENMAAAAEKFDLGIEYCMAPPALMMQMAEFKCIISARASGDYAPRWPKRYDVPYFMQSSMLVASVGVWPFKDTFQSTRRGLINGERCVELMGLISNLSGSIFAPGDEIGMINKDIVKAATRNDGLIYKPSRPITASDLTYVKNSTYYICTTESIHDNSTWHYILTINLWPFRVKSHAYKLKDLGINGNFVEYDWHLKICRKIDQITEIKQKLKEEQYKFRIYAPLFENGYAILGNPEKFVMLSDKEFSHPQATSSGISIQINNIANEYSRLLIYSEKNPISLSVDGIVIPKLTSLLDSPLKLGYKYSSENKLIDIIIPFAEDGAKKLIID